MACSLAAGVTEARNKLACGLIVLLAIAGGALRWRAAAKTEFWLDEVRSWKLARLAPRAVDILVNEPEDNNHPLNTLWMRGVGPGRGWLVYRLPAILSGVACVVLCALVAGAESNRAARVLGAMLAAGSMLMVQYGSEARGYGPAMAFALGAILATDRYHRAPARRWRLTLAACTLLGLLSHPTFLCVYAGIGAWSCVQYWQSEKSIKETLRELIRLHAVSLAVFSMYCILILMVMQAAGGVPMGPWRAIRDAVAWLLGWPKSGWMTIACVGAFAVMAACQIVCMVRRRESAWALYVVGMIVVPVVAVFAWRQPAVYPRYFCMSMVMGLVLVARFLGRAWNAGGRGRIGCVMFLALFIWGNARQYLLLMQYGRGHYIEAIRYISENSKGEALVGSVSDHRNSMMFEFYQSRVGALPGPVKYVNQSQWATEKPQWLLIDAVDWWEPQERTRTTSGGTRYELVRVFRYYGLSGEDWWLMKRQE